MVKEIGLFGDMEELTYWKKEWHGMPEHIQDDLEPTFSIDIHFFHRMENGKPDIKFGKHKILKVNFENIESIMGLSTKLDIVGVNCETKQFYYAGTVEEFSETIGQKVTKETKSIWYPEVEIGHVHNLRWHNDEDIMPKYPIYILSKGRWDTRKTVKDFEEMGIPYHICVEPQEYDMYSRVIDPSKIYKLPFSNLGQGGIPARNWIWEHAKSIGAKYHWTIDDNIDGFGRLHKNLKIRAHTKTVFRCMEDFVDRYENISIAGPQYDYFLPRKSKHPPFIMNTRIYSCILLKTDLDYRWRGKFNEDTDLSIRMLKDGWCSILFYHFFQYKTPTLMDKGGNTDAIYKDTDKRKEFAESLQKQHPDIVRVVWRYDRWHHEVDYSRFKRNKLKKRDIIPESGKYNLKLIKLGDDNEVQKGKEPTEEVTGRDRQTATIKTKERQK